MHATRSGGLLGGLFIAAGLAKLGVSALLGIESGCDLAGGATIAMGVGLIAGPR